MTKQNYILLLDPSKVRREPSRWGGELERIHAANKPPSGLYVDGKSVQLLLE